MTWEILVMKNFLFVLERQVQFLESYLTMEFIRNHKDPCQCVGRASAFFIVYGKVFSFHFETVKLSFKELVG